MTTKTSTLHTDTIIDEQGRPQVILRQEPSLEELIAERLAERMAMDDPERGHPIVGSRHWPLNCAELAEALADAEVTGEIACTDSCTLVFGYLGKARGYKPFMCARTDGSAPHTMFCPDIEG